MSRTSLDVSPKWTQRPSSPTDAGDHVDERGHVVAGDGLPFEHGLDA